MLLEVDAEDSAEAPLIEGIKTTLQIARVSWLHTATPAGLKHLCVQHDG